MSLSALATCSASASGPAEVEQKLSRFSKFAHCSNEILSVEKWSTALRARCRNSSSVRSLVELPTMR